VISHDITDNVFNLNQQSIVVIVLCHILRCTFFTETKLIYIFSRIGNTHDIELSNIIKYSHKKTTAATCSLPTAEPWK